MSRNRLIWLLVPQYLLLLLVALGVVFFLGLRITRHNYYEHVYQTLRTEGLMASTQVRDDLVEGHSGPLDAHCVYLWNITGTRFTVIDTNGVVLGDSDEQPAAMDNHADRPEVAEALQARIGRYTRYSVTQQRDLMYVAVPVEVSDRVVGVVRTALPLKLLEERLSGLAGLIALGLTTVGLLSMLGSVFVSRRISRPVIRMTRAAEAFAQGDLQQRIPVPETDELARLAEALNAMAGQLDERLRTIREQRHQQQAVWSSMVEGLLAVDHDQRVLEINDALAQLLALDPAWARGRSILEVVRNLELQAFVTRTLDADEPLEETITLRRREDLHLQLCGTVLRDEDGKRMGALIVLNDISRIRRLEKVRSDFVANVSHELRTPITSIKGFVETLLDGADDDPGTARHFLQIVGRQANRLNAIIDDLLSLSRMEQDRRPDAMECRRQPIAEMLDAALQLVRPGAAEHGIHLVCSCPDDLQAEINADLLEQAVVNLVDNAVKYSPDSAEVHIRAGAEDGDLRISVEDHGPGISEEYQERIFERFYRIDKARSRALGGTGLGLAIVKHIAQVHRGGISVTSRLGQGSCFVLRVPLKQQDEQGHPPPADGDETESADY